MKKFKQLREEIANSVGSGGVAGFDFPHVSKNAILKRSKPEFFGDKPVFKVDSDTYYKSVQGKKKFKHFKSYVGSTETGENIRNYANKNKNKPIIVQDEKTGAMSYLRK